MRLKNELHKRLLPFYSAIRHVPVYIETFVCRQRRGAGGSPRGAAGRGRGRGGRGGGRSKGPPPTSENLDAELDAYRNKVSRSNIPMSCIIISSLTCSASNPNRFIFTCSWFMRNLVGVLYTDLGVAVRS